MDKQICKENAKLYLEYIRFRDEMLRKTQEDIFANGYRIDTILTLYEIMIVKVAMLPEETLVYLEEWEDILESLYAGWMKIEDSAYQELKEFVENMSPGLFGRKKTG